MCRRDRNKHGGGLVVHVRSYVPSRRMTDLDCKAKQIETIVIELIINKVQWIAVGSYEPNSVIDKCFIEDFSVLLDGGCNLSDNIFVLADLDFDL